jgi:hypothetical protein
MSAHASEKDASAADEKVEQPIVPEDAKIVEAANTDLALALATGPHLSALSIRSIQLYLILLVAFMGSLANGFDGSVMSAVNGMQQYLDYFGITVRAPTIFLFSRRTAPLRTVCCLFFAAVKNVCDLAIER